MSEVEEFEEKLDPILRLLLSSFEEHVEQRQTINNQEQLSIASLQHQSRLLLQLRECVQGKSIIGAQSSYILLPIHLVLALHGSTYTYTNLPLTSAKYKCIQYAADALCCVLSSSNDERQIIDLLTDCLVALNNIVQSFDNEDSRLDKGEECTISLLVSVQRLLSNVPNYDAANKAADGRLLPQLTVATIELLEKSSTFVQLQALDTLGSLLNAIKSCRPLFPGIFATLHRLALSDSSKDVTERSIQTMTTLLSCVLPVESTSVNQHSVVQNALEELKSMSLIDCVTNDGISSDDGDTFKKDFNNTVPALLIILLRLLPNQNQQPLTSQSILSLCRVLLSSNSIWTSESFQKIQRASLQCCVQLLYAQDESVAKRAQTALLGQTPLHTDIIHDLLLEVLTQELPVLAQSLHSTAVLKSKLDLARGYLTLLRSQLVLKPPVSNQIQKSLSVLFDIDFEQLQSQSNPNVLSQHSNHDLTLTHDNISDSIRFRYLQHHDIKKSADRLLFYVGKALGSRQVCWFVDNMIADLQQSLLQRSTVTTTSQASWAHQWVGIIHALNGILLGLGDNTDVQLTDKEKRKQTKRLKALAHAVLETITTSELWTLPTTTVAASTSVGDIQQVSANALKGNAVLLGCLLRLIGTFVALLPKTQQDLLPIILYPVFEKQSCHRLNHSHVRAHAHKTLLTIAAGIRLPDLVDSHFDYLFGALLAGIRGENSGNEAMMAVTNTARVVLNTAIQSKRNSTTRRNLETRTNSSSAVDFMTALIRWFDRNQQHQSETIIVDLLRLMESTILFMGHSFGLTVEGLVHGCRQKSSEQQDHEPWNKWVDRFIVRNEERCPETGFHSSVGSTAKDDTDKLDITPEELDLLSLALARCAYFMGHPTNLAIRVQSCLTQTKAFQFLGFVASNHNNEEEANGPKTAVYRQINESWPAMSARLKSLTEEFVASHRVHRALSKQGILQQRGPTAAVPSGKNIAFLSNLLDLIGAICDVSDDFMFRRLREEVNPCITKLLRCFVEQRASSAETIHIIAKSTHTNVNNGTLLLPEKEKLLVSVLRFLTRIFSQRDLGTSISKFAIMVLPFLDEPTSAVGDATIEALKAMAEVNADSLWIVLSTSAGNGTSLLFETRMRELLTYADGLPEQALD